MPAVREMQQIYDMWLTLTTQNRQADGASITQPVPEEKYIVMPTDYAEPMVGTRLFSKTRSSYTETYTSCFLTVHLKGDNDAVASSLYFRVASTAVCVVSTVTASGSGSSTSPLRSTRTECSAVREKMKL